MRRARRAGLGGGLAVIVTGAAVLALLAGGGGCELVVSDTLPPFTCVPGAASCPADSVCVPMTHECVPRSGTCTPGTSSGCGVGLQCDVDTLKCTQASTIGREDASDRRDATSSDGPGAIDDDATLPEEATTAVKDAPEASAPDASLDAPGACRGIGCSCSGRSTDCDSGICAGELTETSPLKMAIGNFCTQPCCTSADCPASTVCFGTGGGGNYCVRPNWIGRGAQQGGAAGGAACTGDGTCRSGLCAMGACADTCCSNAQQGSECAAGSVCRFAAFPGKSFDTHETASCGSAPGATGGGSPCSLDTSCQSGKCFAFTRCEAVCRSGADCGGAGQACSYGPGPTTLPSNPDIVAACVPVTGTVANGNPCTSSADCLSAFCDGDHCTDVCVTDADCKSGLHCVPETVMVQGSYSVLCCES